MISVRTVSDRGAGDRVGLLLPPRGNLAIWAGFTCPVQTYFAASQPLGFAVPMLIAMSGAAVVFIVTLLFSPETRGKELVPQLTLVAESSAV
jgi:hypothetical protein